MLDSERQNQNKDPAWQCVMICWGNKYPMKLINHLMAQIERYAPTAPRFVLICDQPKPGLYAGAITRDFPPFFLNPAFKKSGCQAKLAMFEKGVLPDDLPSIYIDLDTIVLGDISIALKLMDSQQTVAMLPSAIIPFGLIGRAIWKLTTKRITPVATRPWLFSTRPNVTMWPNGSAPCTPGTRIWVFVPWWRTNDLSVGWRKRT
jgi:hypothetical protein